MLIGLPKEIKANESRVGLTPGAPAEPGAPVLRCSTPSAYRDDRLAKSTHKVHMLSPS